MDINSLYLKHFTIVYKFFYFKTFDQQLAEDLTSQTFLIMVQKMYAKDNPMDNQDKYLYGIMRNVWLRHLQDKYRRNEQLLAEMDSFESYVHQELEREAETSDEERVKRYIDQLPSSQQRVMDLRLIQHRSLSEICKLLDKNMNYVKTTQRRAIQNLRKLLDGDRAEGEVV